MNRILLVDDHEIVRRGLKQILQEELAEVEFGDACNIEQAREMIERDDWSLVLLDINLPGGSGLQLLPAIKQISPNTPVLVLSSYIEEEFAIRSFKLGADGYLTKLSVADEMVAAVNKIIAGGKYVTAALAEKLAAALGRPMEQAPHESLSPRELEVLRQVAQGNTIKEIATALSLSEKTIGTYRSRVSEKLRLSTNVQLTRYALKHHLVE